MNPGTIEKNPAAALRRTVMLALFVSGVAGLMHEIVWAKLLVRLIGSTAHAQAVVLTVFMGGLAIGSVVFGRRADRGGRPLRTYARLEFAVAAYGVVLPLLVRAGGAAYERIAAGLLESPALTLALRFALSVAVVLLPAMWMGATLPVLARALVERVGDTRRHVARLYALNNFGAVVGAGTAGFVTLGAFGIQVSLGIASALNVAAALLVLPHARREQPRAEVPISVPAPPPRPGRRGAVAAEAASAIYSRAQLAATLVALALGGFAAMGYEVVFTRVIALAFGSSTYSFTVMLMSFITGIGIGSAVASRVTTRRPLSALAVSQLGAVVALLATTPLLERLPYWIDLLRIATNESAWGFELYVAGKAGLCLALLLLPTACIGFSFPLVAQVQARAVENVGAAVGGTYAWNTVGNVLGVLGTSLVLLPGAGLLGAFHANLGLHAVAGLVCLVAAREAPAARRAILLLTAAAAAVLYAAFGLDWVDTIRLAPDHFRMRRGPPAGARAEEVTRYPSSSFKAWTHHYVARGPSAWRIIDKFLEDDANTTVLSLATEDDAVLYVNGKPDASTGNDVVTQVLLAQVPMLLAPNPKSLLVIGYGSGITCGSALLHPVERADVVEISRGVLDAHRMFQAENGDAKNDPRVHVYLDDARTFLRTTTRTYDVIISEPSNPWVAGVGALFTIEFFEEARARLNPGGVLCMWFHEYEQDDESLKLVLRTLGAAFPHITLFREYAGGRDVFAIASLEAITPDFAELERRVEAPAVADELARIRAFDLASILAHHAVSDARFASVAGPGAINTDDRERLEFRGPRSFFADSTSNVLWEFDALYQRMGDETDGFLDAYARYRRGAGEPISAGEYEAAARHVSAAMTPSSPAQQIVQALRARGQRAASEASSRPAPSIASRTPRGAVRPIESMGFHEALARALGDPADRTGLDVAALLRRALALRPEHYLARVQLGGELRSRGLVAESVDVLQTGVTLHPESLRLRLHLGESLLQANQPEKAEEAFRAVLSVHTDVEALAMLGNALVKQKRHAEAVPFYRRVYQMHGAQDWQSAAALASALLHDPRGRLEAVGVVEAGLRANPTNPQLLGLQKRLQSAP